MAKHKIWVLACECALDRTIKVDGSKNSIAWFCGLYGNSLNNENPPFFLMLILKPLDVKNV